LTEAAERSGLNRETIRSRTRRGLIPPRRNNAGQLVVQLMTGPDRDLNAPVTAPNLGMTEVVTELQEEITELRDRVTRAEVERDPERDVAAARVEAAERVIAELREMLVEARKPLAWSARSRRSPCSPASVSDTFSRRPPGVSAGASSAKSRNALAPPCSPQPCAQILHVS
jgi:hypothetical protein